ncbi:cupin domain-containing protein [Methylophaga nitratireducenticrescens]|uniref:cupin domain-containing protein n=1 Tax=Methylophaga nitratireducenticrescens TaxID=754476 RepID=UPI000CDBBEC3|nr:cupin domain-containing protein [Methylophaga nitratireducenticrescens]AUZ84162.1 cupin [Methylophaga nitratireducenticrescens]
MTAFFNTGLTQQQFLDEYWQKKPLVIRQAFPLPVSDLTQEDLVAFAGEAEIESRLIEEFGERPWQLQHGPFDEDDFAALPETHWTLLVQDMDKHYPPLQKLLTAFDFIADWRRDDVMISYAPEGGSVGPHTDSYDVFLLQAQGTRHWQISDKPLADAVFRSDTDLRILQQFSADQQWDLHPGDMLYLPPHYAHHGVALNPCLTFSVGFRAPSQLQLLDAFSHTLQEQDIAEQLYADADTNAASSTTEIDDSAIKRFQNLLLKTINENSDLMVLAVGRLVTETKSTLQELADEFIADKPTLAELDRRFNNGEYLQRNEYLRFAWHNDTATAYLFVAGEAYSVELAAVETLSWLTTKSQLDHTDWQQLSKYAVLADVFCELIAEGAFYWPEDFS